MKNVFPFIVTCFFLFGCNEYEDFKMKNIWNPEKAMSMIFEDFEVDRVVVEDLDGDGNLDYNISGYDEYGDWAEGFFMHNGDFFNTYTYWSSDEYWDDYEGYYDEDYNEYYDSVEDYFYDIEDYNTLEEIAYGDLNLDGYEDAVVIANYDSDDYQSIDAYIFTGSENGFYYFGLAEVHYPTSPSGFEVFKEVVIQDEFFTIELSDMEPYWDRFITFKYDEFEDEFLLHKDGGTVFNEAGNLLREEVLTSDDFGDIYFYEFLADNSKLFTIKLESRVSNTSEFLNALSSNRIIYLEEGTYILNELEELPQEVQNAYRSAGDWEEFYTSDFYTFYAGDKDYSSELSLSLRNLKNIDIIGLGDVDFVVTDEFVTVLSLENCQNVYMENIYMVHEVGGVCGANVLEMLDCEDMSFNDCVFDGSGEIACYADESYNLYFEGCSFTNCSLGAIDFYDSDALFDYCDFSDNEIMFSLVGAYAYSYLDFYSCDFNNNVGNDYGNNRDTQYLFYTDEESSIYVDYESYVGENEVDKILNDRDNIIID